MHNRTADSTALCLLATMESAPADKTVGELRADCEQIVVHTMSDDKIPLAEKTVKAPAEERLFDNKVNYDSMYGISVFQPNYFMATYNDNPNEAPYVPLAGDEKALDRGEAKFQISIKVPL